MARVTVEDCVLTVPNRFELCLIASNRAKNILSGAHSELSESGEKPSVIALREIGENIIDVDAVRENIVSAIKNRGIIEENTDNKDDSESVLDENIAGIEAASFISENIEVED